MKKLENPKEDSVVNNDFIKKLKMDDNPEKILTRFL